MNDYSGLFQQIESILEESNGTLTDINGILTALSSIFSFLLMGAYAGLWILLFVGIAIATVVYYVLSSFPVYTLAKRNGYKYAWLAWSPIFHEYFLTFVLCEASGDKPFEPNLGKFRIENRKMSFLAFVLIKCFGGLVIGSIVTFLSFIIPGLGSLSSILALVPAAACALIEYVYLRDLLDVYKEDKKSNSTTALIISVIDFILVGDLARTCYLYTLIKKKPLPDSEQTDYFTSDIIASAISSNTTVEDDAPIED